MSLHWEAEWGLDVACIGGWDFVGVSRITGGCRAQPEISVSCWVLGSYEAGVEGSGEGLIGGALDEGPAVGKYRYGLGASLETEEEAVVGYFSVGLETALEVCEIYGAMMFVDLYGVSATEGDLRAVFSS